MSEDKVQKPIQRVMRLVINFLVIFIVGVAALLAWDRLRPSAVKTDAITEAPTAEATAIGTEVLQSDIQVGLPEFYGGPELDVSEIHRVANLITHIPTRPRVDVITYTVETGDSLFSIADAFNLKPETLYGAIIPS
jgi:hypothetical protein